MRPLIVFLYSLCLACEVRDGDILHQITPSKIHQIHKCDISGYRQLQNHMNESYSSLTPYELSLLDELEKGEDMIMYRLFSSSDSWYIAGEIDTVFTTNIGSHVDHKCVADGYPETAWIDNTQEGADPMITFVYPGSCPRITRVFIFNGNVATADSWEEYGRAKSIKLIYDGKPIAVLKLEDSRSFQEFEIGMLGYHDSKHAPWTLSFEITEVYPGTKTDRVSISEIYFDGIDYL